VAQPSVFSPSVPEQWVPRPCVLARAGDDAAYTIVCHATQHRTYGADDLHFITCSCYRRLPFLRTARSCDSFLSILEQTRQRYRLRVNQSWEEISFWDCAA
jgi:hypothetical protein